jgi:ATP-dependent Zn protease
MTKRSTAYHEAGHAVIGRVLTLASGGATIKPDYRKRVSGNSETADPYECIREWEKRGKWRGTQVAWHARIITFMAGAEAESKLLGSCAGGDREDRKQAELMADELSPRVLRCGRACAAPEWERLEPRLRAMTRMLVRRHRESIERVAKALIAKTTLSAKALDKLVGRSVNDVSKDRRI